MSEVRSMSEVGSMSGEGLRLLGPNVFTSGATESFDTAIRAGRVSGRPPQPAPSHELPVAQVEPVVLASNAGMAALRSTDVEPDDVRALFYAWTHAQGSPFWSPAHDVARRMNLHHCLPFGLQQMCNGAAAGWELARQTCVAGREPTTTVVATGDVFSWPGFDRWAGDYGVLYGDAGTAVVVTNDPGVKAIDGIESRLVALGSRAMPGLAQMHHDRQAEGPEPARVQPISVQATKKAFFEQYGKERLVEEIRGSLRMLVPRVLDEAGTRLTGGVYLPRLMPQTLDSLYVPVVTELVGDVPIHGPEATTGHLGAGDAIANLADIHRSVKLAGTRQQVNLIISAGAGFTVSAAVFVTSTGV